MIGIAFLAAASLAAAPADPFPSTTFHVSQVQTSAVSSNVAFFMLRSGDTWTVDPRLVSFDNLTQVVGIYSRRVIAPVGVFILPATYLQDPADGGPYVSEWQDAAGATHRVITPVERRSGRWQIQAALSLHGQKVRAMQSMFPPVGGGGNGGMAWLTPRSSWSPIRMAA